MTNTAAPQVATSDLLIWHAMRAASPDAAEQVAGIRDIGLVITSHADALIDTTYAAAVLASALNSLYPDVVVAAAQVLFDITALSREHVLAVEVTESVPALLRLIDCDDVAVRTFALQAVGNIVSDVPMWRQRAIDRGIVQHLIAAISNCAEEDIECARIRLLAKLCPRTTRASDATIELLMPIFALLLESSRCDIVCAALEGIDRGCTVNDIITVFTNSSTLGRIIELARCDDPGVEKCALGCVVQLASGDDRSTQQLIDAGGLALMVERVDHPDALVCQWACMGLSNIAAGSRAQIDALFESGVMPKLFFLAQHAEIEIRRDAVWTLGNCTASIEHALRLVQWGFIPLMVAVMKSDDIGLVKKAIHSLFDLLRIGSVDGNEFRAAFDEPARSRLQEIVLSGACEKASLLWQHLDDKSLA